MVAETWKILKIPHQATSKNLKKHSTITTNKSQQPMHTKCSTIGILSFEVANVMSKTIHLHKSLSPTSISALKSSLSQSDGVSHLVSPNQSHLLDLALTEKLDDLNAIADVVSRLGKRCSVPALQGFEHVYADVITGKLDVNLLGLLAKDMESNVKKMERLVGATKRLYGEMAVMSELEEATKKFELNRHEESRKAFEQKLSWQRQDVKGLKDVSLWNQRYDKVVDLLARAVCTIFARVCALFGPDQAGLKDECNAKNGCNGSGPVLSKGSTNGYNRSGPVLSYGDKNGCNCSGLVKDEYYLRKFGQNDAKNGCNGSGTVLSEGTTNGCNRSGLVLSNGGKNGYNCSGVVKRERRGMNVGGNGVGLYRPGELNLDCGVGPGRLFMECLSLSSSGSRVEDDDDDDGVVGCDDRSSQTSGCCSVASGVSVRRELQDHSGCFTPARSGVLLGGDEWRSPKGGGVENGCRFGPKSRLPLYAPPTTVGGSALAMHYANVIIVVEKLLRYPHLVGEDARDDLYQMLPTSLRMLLKASLKTYAKDLAIYDAPLAHDWKERLDGVLRWLAPLAHNMIRWQSERNFEQQQIVTRTNVLLVQTLYFADRDKTEAAVCELLVGLNYICRYEHQQNALLECASSFDFDECLDWDMQYGAS